ncbi:cytochrome C [Leucobacter sp. UCD-THU]|jgi:DeoR/GlpR family transcriptional regulator of sugar metabolism|uniref:DeoR/GlpR family DNA-binding transcription regulator n=1 Tax=Leucobacter sp. UCD-THU TaxID=1292023 RepID=UPI00036ABB40|nr:DeoR/GlpR family DNA-binding transcription regulator [Leucobacter sp. UCD-THU]EYT54891.1 cytochrome C [Leucobacter sp. UCD-THU]
MSAQEESEVRVIPDQRRETLLRALHREKVLSVHQLTDLLGVSHMTVRRDIAALEREGQALSVPGGVKLATNISTEPSRQHKSLLQTAEKQAIARDAAALVQDDMVLYLDAGTTTLAMLPELAARKNLTVVTNDFVIVEALGAVGASTIHIGGFVDHTNRSTVGTLATRILEQLNLDIAFISASSWSLKHGVTTPVPTKVDVKRAVMAAATDRVLLVDSTKYGQYSAYRVAALADFDTIVTDAGLSEAAVAAIRDRDVDLRLAETRGD